MKKQYKEALEESLNDGDQERTSRLENNYRYQELNTTGRYFGESVRATWKLIPIGDTSPYYRVLDICLTEPLENRTGFNEVDVPKYIAVEDYFRGIGVGTANRRVYRVGRTAGFTAGRIQEGFHIYVHEAVQNTWIATKIIKGENGKFCGKGNSGSFITDGGGNVVGILTGALVGKDPKTKQVLSYIGTYIEMDHLVEWGTYEFLDELEILQTV